MSTVAVQSWCESHRFLPCECHDAIKAKKKHKYGAIPQTIDNIRFDSTKEAKRYSILKRMNEDKIITTLEIHPRFDLIVHGPKPTDTRKLGVYEADFSYISQGEAIIEDVKGMITPLAKWKIKHFQIQHGMKVRIV